MVTAPEVRKLLTAATKTGALALIVMLLLDSVTEDALRLPKLTAMNRLWPKPLAFSVMLPLAASTLVLPGAMSKLDEDWLEPLRVTDPVPVA